MTDEVVARVARSARYRDVERGLVSRLAAEELARGGSPDEVAKRVKRRLHQAVGAFRTGRLAHVERVLAPIRDAWHGSLDDPGFRDACRRALAGHASTAERVPHLDEFFGPIWELTGEPPRRLLDLGCGLGPLMLPWMGLARDARYVAIDVDRRALSVADAFLDLVEQPHAVAANDLVRDVPDEAVDVALVLKLLPTLERQNPSAPAALLGGLQAGHAIVSFPARSLGRRAKGMEATYRADIDALCAQLGMTCAEASVPTELVFVVRLGGG
jgi:16S rRNA (guanine(1405)-N(7))-methyltransferase